MPISDDLQQTVTGNVRAALAEDVGSGDVTAELIEADSRARARVITREQGVFCGEPWVRETCRQVSGDIRVDFGVNDGDAVDPDQALFVLEGPARSLLTAERTILNFVQLLSGTATQTRRYADLLAGTSTRLLDTRKTIPGLRAAQKYAVRAGGGHNHRIGLFDAFLVKENHIAAAGGIRAAIERARGLHPALTLEVEVENLAELEEAIAGKADIAMLDNFDLEDTRRAVSLARGKVALEASGGIDDTRIRAIAETGVDYISLGIITKQVIPMDLSMRFV
ncbi:MAG: nicotinate-nucleotide diphosphorylase (carboxylating) [Gammaproteobacteria bacterium]|nr:nicotinate-nucleotide diphosphorylase (carboxylating) [Gammaproteobacteria bacterium]